MPNAATSPSLIAADVGNSRIKLGRFDSLSGSSFPTPVEMLDLPITDRRGSFEAERLHAWCGAQVADGSRWFVASVNRAASQRLIREITRAADGANARGSVRQIGYQDVPLEIRVEEPARVGIDRLVAALAADRLRRPDRAAIVVDLGTAITVDLLEADGAFAGGAILPGIATSARALAEHTDALPNIGIDQLEHPPAALGRSTTKAIEAGLYWGAVGAIREIIARLSAELKSPPEVFLTGGASQHVSQLLSNERSSPVHHVPHLVLSGIALVKP